MSSDGPATVTALAPCTRFAFRGSRRAADLAGEAFGVALPADLNRSGSSGARSALKLGRDEWLLLAPRDEAETVRQSLTAAVADEPHALVDVSDRSVAVQIDGSAVQEVLANGCPLDLDVDAFPVGLCTRTLYGKAEIVLWRKDIGSFRIDVWRSFLPYVNGLLAESLRDYVDDRMAVVETRQR